jgi:hypothetical protein
LNPNLLVFSFSSASVVCVCWDHSVDYHGILSDLYANRPVMHNLEHQINQATKFYTVAPDISAPSAQNLFHITLLAPRI